MGYVIVITDEARKQIEKLDATVKKRMAKKIIYLQKNPLGVSKRLVNFKNGDYRYRVGDYRIIFDINENKIEILNVMHRREVYKGE